MWGGDRQTAGIGQWLFEARKDRGTYDFFASVFSKGRQGIVTFCLVLW